MQQILIPANTHTGPVMRVLVLLERMQRGRALLQKASVERCCVMFRVTFSPPDRTQDCMCSMLGNGPICFDCCGRSLSCSLGTCLQFHGS